MDREEHHDGVQREASAAGLLWSVLFLLFACIAILVGLTLWPDIQCPPPAPDNGAASYGEEKGARDQ